MAHRRADPLPAPDIRQSFRPAPEHYDGGHPFTRPAGSGASMFIQWKGTTVCLDFQCPCGENGHYDGGFAYFIHCPTCDAVYEMGTQVIAKRTDEAGPGDPSVQTLELDD